MTYIDLILMTVAFICMGLFTLIDYILPRKKKKKDELTVSQPTDYKG